jgi:hypothetical protein
VRSDSPTRSIFSRSHSAATIEGCNECKRANTIERAEGEAEKPGRRAGMLPLCSVCQSSNVAACDDSGANQQALLLNIFLSF